MMGKERYEPMIAATYPAAMAGLCLTSLAIISSQFYISKLIIFLLTAASLAFITSSLCIFLHVVLVGGSESKNKQNQDKTWWWSISKLTFLLGIISVFVAICLIFCNFYLTDFEIPTCLNSSF
jgi:hypothetical protein